jgi:hypothetical protein
MVLDMNEEMEQIPKSRRQGKKFQEQILFQVHLLKKALKVKVQELLLKVQSLQHAKFVFKMNANVRNERVVTAMRTRTLLLVFNGQLVTLQIHLLKEAIKVNVQGIILLIIQLLLIMLSMINLYVKMEERIHVHIVVYITIMFQNVGKINRF